MAPPATIEFKNETFYLAPKGWADANVDMMDCERAARALGLGINGRQAVGRVLKYVEDHGPVLGIEIVTRAFDTHPEGATRINWSAFFKYGCRRHGLLHYKKDPHNRRSTVVFAVPQQVG
jgi:hypothetical protein